MSVRVPHIHYLPTMSVRTELAWDEWRLRVEEVRKRMRSAGLGDLPPAHSEEAAYLARRT